MVDSTRPSVPGLRDERSGPTGVIGHTTVQPSQAVAGRALRQDRAHCQSHERSLDLLLDIAMPEY